MLLARPASALTIWDFVVYGDVSTEILLDSSAADGLVGSSGPVSTAVGATTGGIRAGTDVDIGLSNVIDGNVIANGDVKLSVGAQVVGNVDSGGDTKLAFNSSVTGDVTAGGIIKEGLGTTIGGTATEGGMPEVFVPVALPTPTMFSAGGTDVAPLIGETIDLAPGTYGTFRPATNNHVTLHSGKYYFDAIEPALGLDLNFDLTGGPIELFVVGDAEFAAGTLLTLTGGNEGQIFSETHGSWTVPLMGDWVGTVFAPYGDIFLYGDLTGAAYAGGMVKLDGTSIFVPWVIPEPRTWSLMLISLIALMAVRRQAEHSRV
jgi:hypothetical protein